MRGLRNKCEKIAKKFDTPQTSENRMAAASWNVSGFAICSPCDPWLQAGGMKRLEHARSSPLLRLGGGVGACDSVFKEQRTVSSTEEQRLDIRDWMLEATVCEHYALDVDAHGRPQQWSGRHLWPPGCSPRFTRGEIESCLRPLR